MKTLLVALLFFISPSLMAKTYVIQVEGMVCQACVETVTDGFQKLDKNAQTIVDLEKQTVTVDMGELSEVQARSILQERGYNFIAITN